MRPPGHTRLHAWHPRHIRWLPGLGLSLALGLASLEMGRLDMLASRGLSALIVAIVLGMLLGNTLYPRWHGACDAGVGLAKQSLLRAAVVLYGLRLTLQDVAHIGWSGVLLDAAMLCSTFALAVWLGTRWLGLERGTAVLIGAGSSICGAAAVLATGPVARARADQVAVAISTVLVFGTLAVFLYPALHAWMAQWLGPSAGLERFFGLYIGATVHEVAQVVAAARGIGADTASDAVVAKLVRVLMLAPFLAVLSWWLARHPDSALAHTGDTPQGHPPTLARAGQAAITIPWFAIAFMAVVAVNSFVTLPPPVAAALGSLDQLLLATAMAALGLSTQHAAIRRAGFKPLLLAGLLFLWLMGGGGLLAWLASDGF